MTSLNPMDDVAGNVDNRPTITVPVQNVNGENAATPDIRITCQLLLGTANNHRSRAESER